MFKYNDYNSNLMESIAIIFWLAIGAGLVAFCVFGYVQFHIPNLLLFSILTASFIFGLLIMDKCNN